MIPFCIPGYAHDHRPPMVYTQAIKAILLHGRPARLYELDHIIPLELGGSGWWIGNMQLQLWPDARRKDREENELHARVCARKLRVEDAQRQMEDWK